MGDATTVAITLQATGWGIAFLAWQRVDVRTSPRWVVLDLYASTALLGASAACYAVALLLGPAELARALSWIIIGAAAAYVVGTALYWLIHTRVASGPRVGPLHAETERAATGGWTVRDVEPTPRPVSGNYSTASARVRAIMNMDPEVA
jgi:hypothetical protein